ncbi:unnamed protein product [Callosobruchus maculatus]|uniref:Uncharacterized protein n=1 Tax=Callosobruchus maculatus TaxID=64391 RepID=A0A653BJ39_CALMS|nr:unnamed protein product [Callosobruchus maculatus]
MGVVNYTVRVEKDLEKARKDIREREIRVINSNKNNTIDKNTGNTGITNRIIQTTHHLRSLGVSHQDGIAICKYGQTINCAIYEYSSMCISSEDVFCTMRFTSICISIATLSCELIFTPPRGTARSIPTAAALLSLGNGISAAPIVSKLPVYVSTRSPDLKYAGHTVHRTWPRDHCLRLSVMRAICSAFASASSRERVAATAADILAAADVRY